MKRHDLIQGSPEWHAHRAKYHNAADAAAMMGCSPYMTYTELVKAVATGIRPEPGPVLEEIYAEGHRTEKLYQPRAEEIVGDDLYPVVGTNGDESASYDGLRMNDREAWEHKHLNQAIRDAFIEIAQLPEDADPAAAGRLLPLLYQVQMEQQCMVNDQLERVLFSASDWTQDGRMLDERYCWYYPNLELRARIAAGWKQFDADVAAYVPEAVPVKAVGRAPESLPALFVELTGRVTATNLGDYKATALAVFENINRDLKTDQDFADADKTAKWCGDIEDRIAAAKQQALGQTASIEELFRTMDDISGMARDTRLELEKLVKARKEQIRGEIVAAGVASLAEHINSLNEAIGKPYMPKMTADFGGAIKGKRTVESLKDAVNTLLAATKIEASGIATRIQTNMGTLRELAGNHAFLFPDTATIVLKAPDDLTTLVKLRISEHEAKEAARLAAETERIRAQEAARVEREAAAKREEEDRRRRADETAKREHDRQMAQSEIMGIRQQVAIAVSGRLGVRKGGTIECIRETLAETEAWVIGDHLGDFKDAAQLAKDQAIEAIKALLIRAEAPPPAPAPVAQATLAEQPEPAQTPAPAPTVDDVPTLKLGDINARLGLLSVSAENLAGLGFPGIKKGAARMYCESDWLSILHALGAHLRTLRDKAREAANEAVAEAA